MKVISIIENRKKSGMGYIYVIFAFMIIVILLTCTLGLFNSNILQAEHQENSIKAYYIALSGIDIGTAALLQPDTDGSILLKYKFSGQVIEEKDALKDTLEINGGTAEVKIYSSLDATNKRKYIHVCCKGTLDNKEASKTITMTFPYDNPNNRIWDNQ